MKQLLARRRAPLVVGLAALGAVLAPGLATAGGDPTGAQLLSADTHVLSVPQAVPRADCMTTYLAPGTPGVTHFAYTAPSASALSLSLKGGTASDWDMAVFDGANHTRLGGSGAFGADELVQTLAGAGQRLDVQACRVSGAATVPLTIDAVQVDFSKLAKPATQSLVHIDVPGPAAYPALEALGLDLGEDANARGVSAILNGPSDAALLDKAGFHYSTLVKDLAAQDRKDQAADAANTARLGAAGSNLPSGRSEYRHLEDIQADLKTLTQSYPSIVRPVTLPIKTFQGRDQTGVEITGNVNATDDQKPVSFIMAEHHAREWPSEEIATEFAIYLAHGYGTDPEITNLLNHVRVVIVPVINVDGFVASREATDPADTTGDPGGAPSLAESVAPPFGGALAYRRKNCDGASPSPLTPCELQYGVDPNRNYGFNWGGPGASTDTGSQSYRGTGQWSEPETQSVHAYSQAHDVTSLMTLHNFASLVLRPPGLHDGGLAPDEDRLKAIGDSMGDDTGYTSEYSYKLYDTSGTTEDWNYGAAGTFGYTIELGPDSSSGGNFHVAYQQAVIDQWNGTGTRAGTGMRKALLTIAEEAGNTKDFSTLTGRAPAGRILHLHKDFTTSSAPICTIADPVVVTPPDPLGSATTCADPTTPTTQPDKLDYKTTVPANGRFDWLVTPSTHPFVYKAGKTEAWTLTCEDASGKVYDTQQVTIWRNQTQNFDMPCGATLPVLPKGPKDTTPPRSRPTKGSLLATRSGVQLAGTSTDTAPAGLTPRVAKVLVALGRRTGKLCQFVTAAGAFGPKVSCLRTKYLPAFGTGTWTFIYKHKLPAGKYLAWIRGIDAAGNTERKLKTRNLTTFTIK